MKKVININFQGQVIAIEESAYELLKQYIDHLKRYFAREQDGTEIVNDIENRIAELFGNRLKLGIPCITDEDVQSIIANIGKPEDFDQDYENFSETHSQTSADNSDNAESTTQKTAEEPRTLYRNTDDKILGGVCSGIGNYFKTDPVWVRLIFLLFISISIWVYLVLWIILKPKRLSSNIAKKLYRNPTDRFVGGVCGGIATYFNIEAWIPRLLFVVPLFLNIASIVSIPLMPFRIFRHWDVDFNWGINLSVAAIYVVLWVITPKARTVKQKLEMMGEEKYIQSLRETVSENVAQVKNKTENEFSKNASANTIFSEPTSPDNMPPMPPRDSAYPPKSQNERSGCLNAFVVFLKIIFFLFAGILGIVIISLLVGALIGGISIIPLKSLFVDGGTENTLLVISAILLFGVPIVATILWAIRRSMKKESRPIIGVIFALLWLLGLIFAGVVVAKVVNKFKVSSTSEQIFAMQPFKGDTLHIEMLPYKNDYYTYKTSIGGGDFDELPYYSINEDSLLFDAIRLRVVDSPDSSIHVKTILGTSHSDLRKAKQYLSEFTYPIQQVGATLYLPELFQTPIKQGFRNQCLLVEVAMPKGKKAIVSPELDDYKTLYIPQIIRNKYRKYDEWDTLEDEVVEDTVSVVDQTDSI